MCSIRESDSSLQSSSQGVPIPGLCDLPAGNMSVPGLIKAFAQVSCLGQVASPLCFSLSVELEGIPSDKALESRQITALSTVQQQCGFASYMDKWAWELGGLVWQGPRGVWLGETLGLRQSSSWASVCVLMPRWLSGVGARPSHLCSCGLGQPSVQTVSSDGAGKVQEQAWGSCHSTLSSPFPGLSFYLPTLFSPQDWN